MIFNTASGGSSHDDTATNASDTVTTGDTRLVEDHTCSGKEKETGPEGEGKKGKKKKKPSEVALSACNGCAEHDTTNGTSEGVSIKKRTKGDKKNGPSDSPDEHKVESSELETIKTKRKKRRIAGPEDGTRMDNTVVVEPVEEVMGKPRKRGNSMRSRGLRKAEGRN